MNPEVRHNANFELITGYPRWKHRYCVKCWRGITGRISSIIRVINSLAKNARCHTSHSQFPVGEPQSALSKFSSSVNEAWINWRCVLHSCVTLAMTKRFDREVAMKPAALRCFGYFCRDTPQRDVREKTPCRGKAAAEERGGIIEYNLIEPCVSTPLNLA